VNKFLAVGCLALLSFGSAGCPKNQDLSQIPGKPVNQFEWDTYRALLDTEAGIKAAKAQYADGTLPEASKDVLNRAIVVQNTLTQLLRNYDAAARAGNDLTSLEGEITGDLASLLALVGQLKHPAASPFAASPGTPTPAS
jgi:hypothetical protein